jgi:nucleotide-binding universal stress UspA family protein
MYTNILIPTDGSELAGKAVEHGIALAKRIGAKITVLTVLPPFHTFTTDTQMIEDTPAQYQARMKKHAELTLGAAAHAAQAAGVACETVQVEHEQPYEAIINTAAIERLRSDRHGFARPPRHRRVGPRQRDVQGPHALQNSGARPSMSRRFGRSFSMQ